MQSSPFLISFFVFPWLFLRLRHSSDIAPRFSPDYECTQPRRYSRDETTRDDEAAVNGKRVGGRWHLTCSPWKSSTISSSPASLSLSLSLSLSVSPSLSLTTTTTAISPLVHPARIGLSLTSLFRDFSIANHTHFLLLYFPYRAKPKTAITTRYTYFRSSFSRSLSLSSLKENEKYFYPDRADPLSPFSSFRILYET